MTDQHSHFHSGDIIPLPAFRDNYIWLLRHKGAAAVVDPGDADVVEHALDAGKLRLHAILVTHHHSDHVGGIGALARRHGVPVFGPAGENIPALTRAVGEGDFVDLPALALGLKVLGVPGHTATHVAYLAGDALFPGDTLFAAGCGRLLGGTAPQLHESLQRLANLPPHTRVYPAHEYTLANLAFAHAAEPHNAARDAFEVDCRQRRDTGQPTLPTTIEQERLVNPFVRAVLPSLADAVERHTGQRPADALATFTALRAWKDNF